VRIAEDARQYGVYLFGISTTVAPIGFSAVRPIRTMGYVNAGVTGILKGSRLRWHPAIVGADDFWISALNAHLYRRCWIDTRYGFLDFTGAGTFTTPGGAALVRTIDTEEADFYLLRKYFGDAIRPRAKTHIVDAVHDWQRTLEIPWR
jgi:hypothetical protein